MSTKRYDLIYDKTREIRNTIRLLYVSSAKYGADWHSTPHTHNCSELFYVTKGVGQFNIEDHTYPVSMNDLIIINPNVIHTEVSLNANPLEYIAVGVEGFELKVSNSSENPFRIINCQNFRDRILFCLHQMLEEIQNKPHGYETICQDLMEIIVIILYRQTTFSIAPAPVKKDATRLCRMVHQYIDTHYKENLTLDSLAELAHVSKYYLIHTFTREYGISPINYAVACRIDEAKQLLKNDDYTLSFISRVLGFSSQSYFSQIFKKNVGLSPNEYRKQSHSQ